MGNYSRSVSLFLLCWTWFHLHTEMKLWNRKPLKRRSGNLYWVRNWLIQLFAVSWISILFIECTLCFWFKSNITDIQLITKEYEFSVNWLLIPMDYWICFCNVNVNSMKSSIKTCYQQYWNMSQMGIYLLFDHNFSEIGYSFKKYRTRSHKNCSVSIW